MYSWNAKSKFILLPHWLEYPKTKLGCRHTNWGRRHPQAQPSPRQGTRAAVCTHLSKGHTWVNTMLWFSSLLFMISVLISLPRQGAQACVGEGLQVSVNTCVISTQKFLFSKKQRINSSRHNIWFPTLLFSRPWHSQLRGHLMVSTILFAILTLSTLPSPYWQNTS